MIQACILRKLKTDIAAAVGAEARAVITVPAYFDELRRKATADAGEMAGLKVVDIVNEPTAAALAFGEQLGIFPPTDAARGNHRDGLRPGRRHLRRHAAEAGRRQLNTLATDGDVQLGGHDWDKRLVDYAAESFRKSYGVDPREDPAAVNRLFQVVMEAKHSLSRAAATIRVEHRGYALEVPIRREQFEEMTADLLERTAYTSRQLIAAAKLHGRTSTAFSWWAARPACRWSPRMLQKLTGIQPDRTVNPDEAVARGAGCIPTTC